MYCAFRTDGQFVGTCTANDGGTCSTANAGEVAGATANRKVIGKV